MEGKRKSLCCLQLLNVVEGVKKMEPDSFQRYKRREWGATVAATEISAWCKEKKSTMRVFKILQPGTRVVVKTPVLEILKTHWTSPWASWSSFKQEVGPNHLQMSPPTKTTLWFVKTTRDLPVWFYVRSQSISLKGMIFLKEQTDLVYSPACGDYYNSQLQSFLLWWEFFVLTEN